MKRCCKNCKFFETCTANKIDINDISCDIFEYKKHLELRMYGFSTLQYK